MRKRKMKHDEVVGYIGSSIPAVLSVTQTNEVFQLIQIILASISFLLTIAYTCWKWYKKAKEDGKITTEEVEELFDNLKENIKENENDKFKR